MKNRTFLQFLFIILFAILFFSCTPKTSFDGVVMSRDSTMLDEAQVKVNGSLTSTREGKFSIKVDQSKSYVVTIKKPGYSLYSKNFAGGIKNAAFVLEQATVKTFTDATQPIDVQDTINRQRPEIKFENPTNPLAAVPKAYNAEGKLVGFGWPSSIKKEIESYNSVTSPVNGFRVQIPANGLAASGNVSVAVTTINIFESNAMPGDYSARVGERQAFMLSYGAGVIDVFQGSKSINQLNKGMKATISIPVDSSFILSKQAVPDSIPFLTFDEDKGTWIQEGWGKYDKQTNSYSAQTSHFSAFNFDVLKVDPSCAAFDFNKKSFIDVDPLFGRAMVEVYSTTTYRPQFGVCYSSSCGSAPPCTDMADLNYVFKSGDCSPNDSLFAIKNIPNNAPLVFIVKTYSDGNSPFLNCRFNYPNISNVAVIATGGPATALGASNEPSCDYVTPNGCVKPPAFERSSPAPLQMAGCATQNGTTYDARLFWVYNYTSPTDPTNSMTLYQHGPAANCNQDPTTDPGWTVSTSPITNPDTYVYMTEITGLPAGSQQFYKVRVVDGGVTKDVCLEFNLMTAATCSSALFP